VRVEEASFVLVPGAGGDAWYWHRVVPLLEPQAASVVAVALPAADESLGWRDYADVIVDSAVGLDNVVLVAQSMAAFSAPVAAERLPVEHLVLVAPMIPAPGETGAEWWQATGQVEAARAAAIAEERDPDAGFDVVEIFMHDVPENVVREVMSRPEPRQAEQPFLEPWPLDAWPDVPTSVIAGRNDRLFPYEFMVDLARKRLGLTCIGLDTGHLPALSRPRDLVDAIIACLSPVR
jgi:pimeloyl-ACP methyl ester carboxylesterase